MIEFSQIHSFRRAEIFITASTSWYISMQRWFASAQKIPLSLFPGEQGTEALLLSTEEGYKIIPLRLDAVFISLDGPDDEEYNEIRRTEFAPVVDNIKALNTQVCHALSVPGAFFHTSQPIK
ncbi:hypothetical protein P378_03830 [Desulforamulus profundi]|uniref:Uncharacterized protein n=1 Tax=Desulforamulus profundi TaxID=1383067 RepID=A0A2C6MAG6_9FIRM|nr:hypothetical protein [Desulforamulus profundi]PHJ39347.1 hypothetical protein P378_03830 [Desulforamulus profundi]